ncbi:MAG: glycosyl hydrolase family 18 protein [Halanaerobiaceae bacterium]
MKPIKNNSRSIALILLIIITLPVLLTLVLPLNQSAEAGTEEISENTPWLKGLLLILISFFTNNYLDLEDEPTQEAEEEKPSEPESETEDRDEKEVLGFYVNWLSENSSSLETLRENHENIDMIAPFWYTLNPDGEIESRYGGHQYEAETLANNKNTDILPLINNNQSNNMILVDPKVRSRAITNIVNLVKKYNYGGVNIDFEFIPPWTRSGYSSFIKELKEKMPEEKLVTVSVFPKIDIPLNLHGAFDYETIGRYVDRFVIMTYDHHWASGPAGPVAPLDWVEQNIKYTLEYVPAEKVLLGIANYGYDWARSGKARDLSEKAALQVAEENKTEIQWHNTYQTPHYNYTSDSGESREVWFENSRSAARKMDLVNEYNLKGIAIWRLGNSSNQFWDNIADILK